MITNCDTWARQGECVHNPHYMEQNCQHSCLRLKDDLDAYWKRCPLNVRGEPRFEEDMLEPFLESLVESVPEFEPELVSKHPHIVVFDKFVTRRMAESIIRLGEGRYIRSSGLEVDTDGSYKSVKTSIRTSENAWCQEPECTAHPDMKETMRRISMVTNVSQANMEYMQLLRYHSCSHVDDANCSFYRKHSDYIHQDLYKQQGVRVLTAFLYLNTVLKGGETVFDAGVTVVPKQGRMVLWPSVLNAHPDRHDPRLMHEAKPVLQGEKFAANVWVHQYDFKTPHSMGCSM